MTFPARIDGSTEGRVLVLGADPAERRASRVLLEKAGYAVIEAANAQEAIDVAQDQRPDLAVLIIDGSLASGTGPFQALLANPLLQHLPILVCTALEDFEPAEDGMRAGATDVIIKPTEQALLPYRVRSLLLNARREQALADADARAQTSAIALATMSHEIRTPLNDLTRMIDLLEQSKLDNDQVRTITKVRESAYQLLNTIGDILDFSKIEAGELVIEQADTSVTAVVEDVIETLLPAARRKNIGLSVFTSPRIPDPVTSDPLRMRQVLLNLIGNAINFSRTDGAQPAKVQVQADLVASDREEAVFIRFTVADSSGCIAKDRLARLFTPYIQAEESTLRQFGGTGLGLAISRNLVELMGGTISVESEPGKGSVFTVDLPFISSDLDLQQGVERLSNLHILLVALDSDLERAARTYLTHDGAEILTAADLEDAEQLIIDAADSGRSFDVAIIAHSKPQAVDAENAAIAALIALPGCKHTRFVLLSDDRRGHTESALPTCTIMPKHPLSRTSLMRAVLDAAGGREADTTPGANPDGETPPKNNDNLVGGLILLAEDNAINQLVIQRQIAEFGYAVDVASDGEEALGAFQTGNYRLLLVDCHMPNMDGFELTQAIREVERHTGGNVAIVAITGDADKDDVDRCLNAGMNDHLAKPVALDVLGATLNRWLGDGDTTATGNTDIDSRITDSNARATPETISTDGGMSGDDQSDDPIDLAVLASLLGTDDDAYLHRMVKMYWDSMRDTASELNDLFSRRDALKLRDAAHAAKGASSSVGAVPIASLLKELQFAATDADWGVIEGLMARIETEFSKLEQYVETIQAA